MGDLVEVVKRAGSGKDSCGNTPERPTTLIPLLLPKPYSRGSGSPVVKSVQPPSSPSTPKPYTPTMTSPIPTILSSPTTGSRPIVPPKPEFLKNRRTLGQGKSCEGEG